MWIVLVGGDHHLQTYNVRPDMWQIVCPAPVPNEFYDGRPSQAPWSSYQNQLYQRQWVVNPRDGHRCDRLFFFMPTGEITEGLIEDGMRRLRGVQVEKLA